MRREEARNQLRATRASQVFAPYVGSPVIHAAHSGEFTCPSPLAGPTYSGHFEGGASICDHTGTLLAYRGRDEGPGAAIADVAPARLPTKDVPGRFWLQERGAIAAATWWYQNLHGRQVYRRQVAGRPVRDPATVS